jgi:hypothetical protein
MLGFPYGSSNLGPFGIYGEQFSLYNPAFLNTTSSIMMACDICGSNVYKNGSFTNAVASILINADPFSIINFEPRIALQCPISRNSIDSITVSLYDQNNNMIDMNTNGGINKPESYSCVLQIESI